MTDHKAATTICPGCDGDGFDSTGWKYCTLCNGIGSMPTEARTVCWFSCGAASAVATKLTLAEDPSAVVVRIDTGSEHPDNERFMADAIEWFGKDIVVLKSERYADVWQVWNERRFLVGPTGALCTAEMKKKPRYAFENPDDLHIFGYTADAADAARAERFAAQNPGVTFRTPLIERGVTKQDCLTMLARQGIKIPAMYLLGYTNNNCIGCPKGGMGYWNKIRRDFPEVYNRMAVLERELDHSVNKDDAGPVWLDEMDPDRGDYGAEPDMSCSLNCAMAEVAIAGPSSGSTGGPA